MAKSNRDRVSDVMDALIEGLSPFVVREYKMVYRSNYLKILQNVLERDVMHLPADTFDSEQNLLFNLDSQGWLKAMLFNWNEVFRSKLGHSERSYTSELLNSRNDWAHQKPFTNDDAQRVADTATRLLEAVGAVKEAAMTRGIMQELRRLSYEAEMKQAQKQTGT
ncbi:MAG: AAA+ family ATPase, partial [Acidobacteria bacterium]|nr:AAA+ family ATPase [Acidobacteriota bacterium]